MSRSNPTNNTPNPASKWIEWGGADGSLSYYDKTDKKKVPVPIPFTFLVLDELSAIRGWHESSGSNIFSNEVRGTANEVLSVKSFKGGPIAEGLYKDIKDKVGNAGGHFVSNIYIGIKKDQHSPLEIAVMSFKGAAVSAWFEFKKSAKDLLKGAVTLTGSLVGQKGSVKYRYPVFQTTPVSDETNEAALELDKQLQEYLTSYFRRIKEQSAPGVASHPTEDEGSWIDDGERLSSPGPGERNDPEDIPFSERPF